LVAFGIVAAFAILALVVRTAAAAFAFSTGDLAPS